MAAVDKLDLMTILAQVKPGGVIDENETRTPKNYTFILKGKRTLEMQAYSEDEAKANFEADPIYGQEKIIDIIESDIVEAEPVKTMPDMGRKGEVIAVNPYERMEAFKEEFARRVAEGQAALAAEGKTITGKAAVIPGQEAPAKKTTRKKKS